MIGIIGVGFLVNYMLRALPFLLFAGRDRELPAWVDRLGKVISPIIIGCLIVYSYSGEAWQTPWPYLAGVVTVVLQVWRRNPLMSIIAGTVVYMVLLNCCGCRSYGEVEFNDRNPSLKVTPSGVQFADTFVEPAEVPEILEGYDVPHDRVIHILLDPDVRDLTPARVLMTTLSRAGYRRPVLVTRQHATSANVGRRNPSAQRAVGGAGK